MLQPVKGREHAGWVFETRQMVMESAPYAMKNNVQARPRITSAAIRNGVPCQTHSSRRRVSCSVLPRIAPSWTQEKERYPSVTVCFAPYAPIVRRYLREKVHTGEFCHTDLRTIPEDWRLVLRENSTPDTSRPYCASPRMAAAHGVGRREALVLKRRLLW